MKSKLSKDQVSLVKCGSATFFDTWSRIDPSDDDNPEYQSFIPINFRDYHHSMEHDINPHTMLNYFRAFPQGTLFRDILGYYQRTRNHGRLVISSETELGVAILKMGYPPIIIERLQAALSVFNPNEVILEAVNYLIENNEFQKIGAEYMALKRLEESQSLYKNFLGDRMTEYQVALSQMTAQVGAIFLIDHYKLTDEPIDKEAILTQITNEHKKVRLWEIDTKEAEKYIDLPLMINKIVQLAHPDMFPNVLYNRLNQESEYNKRFMNNPR